MVPPADPKVLVVRCWKKSHEQIVTFLSSNRDLISKYDIVVFSVDHVLDSGSTEQVLLRIKAEQPWFLDNVVMMTVEGPAKEKNWTRLLNAPIHWLEMQGIERGLYTSMSFEAQVEGAGLGMLTDRDYQIPAVTIRQASDEAWTGSGVDPCEGFHNRLDLADRTKECFRALRSRLLGEVHDKDRLWRLQDTCRNTLCSWSLSDLIDLRGFDPRCNGMGGQEDTHLLARLIGREWGTWEGILTCSEYSVVRYCDPRLAAETEEEKRAQAAKFSNERNAIEWAIEDVMSMMRKDDFTTPEPDRFRKV